MTLSRRDRAAYDDVDIAISRFRRLPPLVRAAIAGHMAECCIGYAEEARADAERLRNSLPGMPRRALVAAAFAEAAIELKYLFSHLANEADEEAVARGQTLDLAEPPELAPAHEVKE